MADTRRGHRDDLIIRPVLAAGAAWSRWVRARRQADPPQAERSEQGRCKSAGCVCPLPRCL